MKLTPKDFFLNVAVTVTLYVSAVTFVLLLFQYIDRIFPRTINGFVDPHASDISFGVAFLIVVFPLYVLFVRLLNKEMRTHKEKSELGLRKWLIFFTLFVAGATVAIDLIILLHTFFSGQELTIGFLLKVGVVLAVIGGIFYYYLVDLKGKWQREEKLSKTIGLSVVLIVLVSIIAGFFVMGSPQANRELRIDREKINNLQNLQWQIVNYWQQKEQLPQMLSQLEDSISGFEVPNDPQTGEAYVYRVGGRLTFELCAEFNRESSAIEQPLARPSIDGRLSKELDGANWQHTAGEHCFERTIDPELYPPRDK